MIAPVDLGQALAFPGVYMEWPPALPVPEPAPRARHPRRVRRNVAALASVAVAAGLALARCVPGTRALAAAAWDVREAGR